MKDDMASTMAIEGEPHPAEMLANLIRAEAGARTAGTAPAAATDTSLTAPAGITPYAESIPAAARALAAPAMSTEAQELSAMQRTLQTLRGAMPVLQKLLPLLDGNVLGALVGLLAPQAHAPRPVDLSPLETTLAELKGQQQEMRGQIQGHDAAIRKMADQLDRVREATERNTQEQQELVDELKVSGRRMNIVAFLAFALLAASIAMNVVLYLEIHRLLP